MGQKSLIPVPVTSLVDVADLVVGGGHRCAVCTDGTVWCWGAGGTLGNVQSQTQPSDVPLQVDVLDDVQAMARGSGNSSFICAIRSDSSLWCWGRNKEGNLGDGTYGYLVIAPVQTLGLTDIVSAATGHEHACASTTDGVAFCWGNMFSPNQFGQLGSGSTGGSATAVQVVDLDSVVFVSAGGFFSCAVRQDGSAWCWGLNYSGELGVGDESQQSFVPLQVAFP
jgi:alpha-tubulin suppressor-like RCC1 family protein